MTKLLTPAFDAKEFIDENITPPAWMKEAKDFQIARTFLKAYEGSQGTFNSYRREVERLLQWSSLIVQKSLSELKRQEIEDFIAFCQNPPNDWIGTKKVPRFILKEGLRVPNTEWKPFTATVSKAEHRKGKRPDRKNFELSFPSLKETFAILGSFYNYLLQEEYVYANPVALIRQKSKFLRRQQGLKQIRRLTDMQWHYVIEAARKMAEENPEMHERTLFMMTAFYTMYLRISELAASERWTPKMCDFHRDGEGDWWFTTVGKGNKMRQIAVSDSMLIALKRWRQFLGLTILPSPGDDSPLLPKEKGRGPIQSTTYLREIVQQCFDRAMEGLRKDNQEEEAEALLEVTVHWLRHTGISDDVKRRPREHVRDDAGHSSSAITDRYIDIELRARHNSARDKPVE